MAKERRGFASMSPERRREIARKGGFAAQAKGVAHRWDSIEASIAGRKGGMAGHAKRKAQKLEQNPLPLGADVNDEA